ncbi:hypothetical protein ACIBO2_53145 [Nonomuraea sp. NPDC050022]|uniref:hypothetical protein n=1 Tax=unclassified Nonomuraea TaxID=2593643 RepID=UPI0033F7665A
MPPPSYWTTIVGTRGIAAAHAPAVRAADSQTVGFRNAVVVAAGDYGEEGTRHLAVQGRAALGVRA